MSENMVTILDKHPSGAFYVMQYDFFLKFVAGISQSCLVAGFKRVFNNKY